MAEGIRAYLEGRDPTFTGREIFRPPPHLAVGTTDLADRVHH